MEQLLLKIRELERDAQTLIEQPGKCNGVTLEDSNNQQEGTTTSQPEPRVAADDGDWVSEMKIDAGRWNGNKLVVLSLFDGIGGVWAALTRLGIPFLGYSSEVSAPAVEVVKARFPEVQHLGDVRGLARSDITHDVDLIVGGFPCQDLSCMGRREGLHGQRSKLFFDLLEAMRIFRPKWFLVENVASMAWIDRLEISKYTGVRPLELDSIELTPTKRRRLYWTNIPHPLKLPRVRDHPSTLVQSCLQNAIALEEKTGVLMSQVRHNRQGKVTHLLPVLQHSSLTTMQTLKWQALERLWRGPGAIVQEEGECMVILSTNSTPDNYCQLELVMEIGTPRLRYLNHQELEMLLGYQPNHTGVFVSEEAASLNSLTKDKHSKGGTRKGGNGATKTVRKEPLKAAVRWLLLGNTFSVQVITYLLSPLLKGPVRELGEPVQISTSTSEKECAVMEVGDVWALYNEQERPNWYALIVDRTGDRFSHQKRAPHGRSTTRLPLRVEMQYLEITNAYSRDEADKWNPLRGTGLYKAREAVDIQESWTAFSHRVTSFVRSKNKVFVFPGKNELWTVYCQKNWSPFFVFVMESTINIDNVSTVVPNSEGFSARCSLVIKTAEKETYRRTETVLELEDLSMFCFQVPYTFKHQADLLRVEIGTGGRRNKKFERHIRSMRKRKLMQESSSCDEGEKEDEEDLLVQQQDEEILINEPVVDEEEEETPSPCEEQEIFLEVDLRCQCGSDANDSESVIIIDDDDD